MTITPELHRHKSPLRCHGPAPIVRMAPSSAERLRRHRGTIPDQIVDESEPPIESHPTAERGGPHRALVD